MSELKQLLNDIEILRKNLINLIETKQLDLQDPEIIKASQILNTAISKYNDYLKDKL